MLNKRPRLKRFDYTGCYSYFITICTHNKIPLLKDAVLVKQSINMLKKKSDVFGFKVWAFCYMPDHLHLLIEGRFPDSDLKRFISSYKQSTGYYYSNHHQVAVAQDFSPALWQPSYYDHILRKNEAITDIAKYIFNNPVRKGLVMHYTDYEHTGSFELDMKHFF